MNFPRRTPTQIDQQQKSTAQQIKHEKFVPSPELDEPSEPPQLHTTAFKQTDNFYPTNQYYKPLAAHGFYHGTANHIPAGIINSSSKWKHTKELPPSPPINTYHQLVEQSEHSHVKPFSHGHEKGKKLLWNPANENGQWVWMPNQEQTIEKIPPTATEVPAEKWKWNFNDIFSRPTSQSPISYDTAVHTYHHHHHTETLPPTSKEHPYSFDSVAPMAPTTEGTSTLPSVFIYETSSDEEERYKHENRYQHQLDMFAQHGPATGSTVSPTDWSQYLSVNSGRDHGELNTRRPR